MHATKTLSRLLVRRNCVNGALATRSRHAGGSNLDIAGIYPPIATPFLEDGSIAYSKLHSNILKWNSINFKGLVVQGSNGEYAYLNYEERIELVKQVKENIAPGKLIIAGSGCESTKDTIEMSTKMSEVGADAVMVVTPCFYKDAMTNSAMIEHYTKVADSSPVPIILYSVPKNTGIDLAADVIIKLSAHPNIIGLKDSGGDISKLGNLVYKTKSNDFQILAGSAGFLLPALATGCVGGVCALSNVLGNETCQLYELFREGHQKEAMELQHRLISPNAAVTKVFGVAGLKAAMEFAGLFGGPCRSPMQSLNDQDRSTLKDMFLANGFLDKCDH